MELGAPEILIILAIVLVLFGPSRIPEIGRSLGRSISEFRRGLSNEEDNTEKSDLQPRQ